MGVLWTTRGVGAGGFCVHHACKSTLVARMCARVQGVCMYVCVTYGILIHTYIQCTYVFIHTLYANVCTYVPVYQVYVYKYTDVIEM